MRNCLACKHCRLNQYSSGYSEYTPSTPMSLYCVRGKWDADDHSKEQILERAALCEKYEPEPWARKYEGGQDETA